MPCGRKTAKMIEQNYIDVNQQGPQAIDAPLESGLAQGVPVVDGIAPELSLGAEVVGRHAGDETRPKVVIEEKKLGASPHITRIRRYEKWQITNQANALGVSIFLETIRLPE